MDDSVRRAMQIWPNVPECYGWLRLDRRGNWLLTNGDGSAGVGRRISNNKVCDFIARNYLRTTNGSYFFQNGPQRVHVELAYTPYIVSVPNPDETEPALVTHLGDEVDAVSQVWIDEQGALLLEITCSVVTSAVANEAMASSIALVDDRDTERLLACLVDAAGVAAGEAKLLEGIERLMAGESCDLKFHWRGNSCTVKSVTSGEIERLGFIQELKPLAS